MLTLLLVAVALPVFDIAVLRLAGTRSPRGERAALIGPAALGIRVEHLAVPLVLLLVDLVAIIALAVVLAGGDVNRRVPVLVLVGLGLLTGGVAVWARQRGSIAVDTPRGRRG